MNPQGHSSDNTSVHITCDAIILIGYRVMAEKPNSIWRTPPFLISHKCYFRPPLTFINVYVSPDEIRCKLVEVADIHLLLYFQDGGRRHLEFYRKLDFGLQYNPHICSLATSVLCLLLSWFYFVLTTSAYGIKKFLPISDSRFGLLRNATVVVNCASMLVLQRRTRPPSDCLPMRIDCAYISSALFSSTDSRLLFAGRQRSLYLVFYLSISSSFSAVVVAVLLLLGGVEPNTGPAGVTGLRLGLVNSRSAVTKAAVIHDIISHECLDVLVLTETRMHADLPPAIVDDIAPPDLPAKASGQGGGVAVTRYGRKNNAVAAAILNLKESSVPRIHRIAKMNPAQH